MLKGMLFPVTMFKIIQANMSELKGTANGYAEAWWQSKICLWPQKKKNGPKTGF